VPLRPQGPTLDNPLNRLAVQAVLVPEKVFQLIIRYKTCIRIFLIQVPHEGIEFDVLLDEIPVNFITNDVVVKFALPQWIARLGTCPMGHPSRRSLEASNNGPEGIGRHILISSRSLYPLDANAGVL
jgi:hypothetical protein